MTAQAQGALAVWREKLDFLLREEAVASDPTKIFELSKAIERAKARIKELSREGLSDTEQQTATGESLAPASARQANAPRSTSNRLSLESLGLPRVIPLPILLSIQWVLAVSIEFYNNVVLGVFVYWAPLWAIPIAALAARFGKRDKNVARLLGLLAGGMIGAGLGFLIGVAINLEPGFWGPRIGFVLGAFIAGSVAGHLIDPDKKVGATWAIAGTALLLAGLGIFEYPIFFGDQLMIAFDAGAFATLTALLVGVLLQSRHRHTSDQSE